ncbi:hypothetical protein [Streptomyces sp. NPDC101115]|uniref:hypothetical protein n=1 Tax=Streptomyces sp. NPDC101115 TaxID=3366106 RepID=UPI003828CA74
MTENKQPRKRRTPAETEAAFRARVIECEGVVVGEYRGTQTPVAVVCSEGHVCSPYPGNVLKGRGICKTCARQDAADAEHRFRQRVAELGGAVTGLYVNSRTPVELRCAEGHACFSRPSDVLNKGRGICRTCAGNDSAEPRFHARVAELGGTVLGKYVNANTPVAVRCARGHEHAPRPTHLMRGGICRTCAGLDPADAERRFRAKVVELGGVVVGEYANVHTPVELRCREEHACSTRPTDALKGRGICRTCAGNDPADAELRFRSRVAELGGVVLGEYVNASTPVAVLCAEGHKCAPRPNHTLRGVGICRTCAGKAWDVLYVVTDLKLSVVKFGVTSGGPRRRLSEHRYEHGLTEVHRLHERLPGTVAPDLERHIKRVLRARGHEPMWGSEYFPGAALTDVLAVVDELTPANDQADAVALLDGAARYDFPA